MSIPGNAEPEDFSGQQQVQQPLSINFSGAIPIKKRRFPIIRPSSPPSENKFSSFENYESKNKQESETPDEERPSRMDARNTSSSPGNPDLSQTSALIAEKEATPNKIELGQANVAIFASKPQQAKPAVSLNPVLDLGNKTDILLNERSPDREERSSLIDARNTSFSPGHPDQSQTSALVAENEVTPNNIELQQANVNIFAPKPQETKPAVSLNPVLDLGNKLDILLKEQFSDHEERSSLIEARNTSSPGNSYVTKTTDLMVKKEFAQNNIESGQANVGIFLSKPQQTKPTVSLNPVCDLGIKLDILSKQKSSDREESSSLMEARHTSSPGNSAVSKTTDLIVKKEVTPNNIESEQANVDIFASKPQETKPTVSLNPDFDLGNNSDILSKEKTPDCKFEDPQTENVEQAIFSGQTEGTCQLELLAGSMSVELSLLPKEPIVPPLKLKKTEAICIRSDKSDPSLLSLALSDEKLVRREKSESTIDDVGSGEHANRSNWDLNTTMDVWEGSTSNAFSHKFAVTGGFETTDSFHDEKSSLTTTGTIGFSWNKGKHIMDVCRSNSSNAIIQLSQQCKTDFGLRLAMPNRELDARKELSSSDNLISTNASANLSLQRVHISATNVNRNVKSEPVDDNLRRDCSVGSSSSSSNIGLLKLSYVKTEFVKNQGRETVLHSPTSLNKFGNCKSENGTLPQSVARLMQHQESCASSSSSPLLVPLKPQSSCSLSSPTFSELTLSRNLSSRFGNHCRNKESHDRNDSVVFKPVGLDEKQLRPCNAGNYSVVYPDKCKLARVDEDTVELCQHAEEAKGDGGKIMISHEMNGEESFESYTKSGNCGADNSMEIEKCICDKEDEEYEDGEVREPLECSAIDQIDVENKMENIELVTCDSRNLQPFDLWGNKDIKASDFDGKDSVKENREEIYNDSNEVTLSISCMPNSEDNSLQKVSDRVLEVGVDEKRTISVTPGFDLSGNKDVEGSPGKEILSNRPVNVNCGIGVELEDEANDKVVKEICSLENNSILSKVDESLNDHDAARDSNNKSRVINLASASFVTSPCKTRSVPNRLLTTQSGKETYSDLDGEIQPRGNRNEIYTGGGSNKFANYRVHDQPFRNSRPSFMHGRGRVSGRFGSSRNEWDSDHDFASETSYGPSDYRSVMHKHSSDAEIECNGYDIQQDDSALGGDNSNRRKPSSYEFRRTSLRRFSPGDRDGPPNRRNQTLRRLPRNISPNRCNDDKFMRHLSNDMTNPVYNHPPEAMYDEFDGKGQHVRGNRNFSTLQRKSYPRNRSKSPVRSGTRSPPGPWSSPQHQSPGLYRMGRMRSPDRSCFRSEMVSRRRWSPSYVTRHPNDLRDVNSGRDHVQHPRSANPNRRSSPERVFPRSGRRKDALDSDGDEYMNGPNKFHELRGDVSIDERRKLNERRGPGPVRSFRPGYGRDGENFRFHANDGPRPYRFCADVDTEFVDRGHMREREFDGRMKHHQGSAVSRRVRNVEEQQDGNYRPVERVWHDDGFGDGRVKRRRF